MLTFWHRRWFRFRVAFYVIVILALLVFRGDLGLTKRVRDWLEMDRSPELTVAGLELGCQFLDEVLDRYRQEHPQVALHRLGGGTAQAFEALLRGDANVAIASRQPTATEQRLFVRATGDTVSSHRFALGAFRLLCSTASTPEGVRIDVIRELLAGEPAGGFDRLYTLDPNLGLWNVLHERVHSAVPDSLHPSTTFFWSDAASLRKALAVDPRALGIVSSLCDTSTTGDDDIALLPLILDESGETVSASDENVASGSYRLYHSLYAVVPSDVKPTGARLVTHLLSDRGQRQVWRAGALPARLVAREVILTHRPLDASRP